MKFIAIDPGYDRCGFVVGEVADAFSGIKILDYGYITSHKGESLATRLYEIARDFETILRNFSPNVLFVEKVFFSKNRKTALMIAKIIGVLEYIGMKYNLNVVELAPNYVKKVTTGNGQAQKRQVEYMIKKLYKQRFSIEIDDVADAFAIAYAGISKIKFGGNRT